MKVSACSILIWVRLTYRQRKTEIETSPHDAKQPEGNSCPCLIFAVFILVI
jgi:hypothetical protein